MSAAQTSGSQVLIVGAGPTVLTLAAQLLARGITTRIIDKSPAPLLYSRALGVHARTLELLDTMGMSDAFLEQGHRVRHLRMYSGRRNLLDLDLARNGSRYGFVLHLPQQDTERLLRDRVRDLGGTVEQGVELVHIRPRHDAVDATLRDATGRESEVSVGYVGRSTTTNATPSKPTSPCVRRAGRHPAHRGPHRLVDQEIHSHRPPLSAPANTSSPLKTDYRPNCAAPSR